MELIDLIRRKEISYDKKLQKRFDVLKNLLAEIKQKQISQSSADEINILIEEINSIPEGDSSLKKKTGRNTHRIIALLEKNHKIVPRKFYLNRWLALGMAVFGVPIGVVIGNTMGNMAFLALGISFGMVIGMALGAEMDKKAQKEGRQLNINYEF